MYCVQAGNSLSVGDAEMESSASSPTCYCLFMWDKLLRVFLIEICGIGLCVSLCFCVCVAVCLFVCVSVYVSPLSWLKNRDVHRPMGPLYHCNHSMYERDREGASCQDISGCVCV